MVRKNSWDAISNRKGTMKCLLETRDMFRSSVGGPSREYMATLHTRIDRLLNYHKDEQPMTDTERVRMFIVEGLPQKNIPVPPQVVMRMYLEGIDRPMKEYLQRQLTEPYVAGSYTVSIDPDIVRDHLEEEIDRISVLAKVMLILLDDLSTRVEGPDYRTLKAQVESTIIEYVPTTLMRIYTDREDT